ncbi:hypothetical protein MtrunA17_Chr3g0123221 [Medicago truncatula]|uniref:RNase H type-1 domain-containing protein n=1 Tax=Medicago truncatula TaxID=3880 RepID=A0A396IXZ7_MEDTR|nr:hypothetical protein MtrunA17_Chr3g0123221 [Medicago truncatula]
MLYPPTKSTSIYDLDRSFAYYYYIISLSVIIILTSWVSWSVTIGEAVGLHTALQWISDLQFDNVDFALDSKQDVDSFHTGVDDDNELGCIITACRQLFQDSFQNSHVEFNRRQANGVAHELARVAPSFMMMYPRNVAHNAIELDLELFFPHSSRSNNIWLVFFICIIRFHWF